MLKKKRIQFGVCFCAALMMTACQATPDMKPVANKDAVKRKTNEKK